MKRIILPLLISLIIVSCESISDDPGGDPGDDPGINTESVLAEATIGPTGGNVEAEDITLVVPADAFSSQVTVQILKGEQYEDDFGSNSATESYEILGFPEDFTKPIEVHLATSGSLANENYLAVGTELDFIEYEDTVVSYALYEARDSSGYLVASIEPKTVITYSASSHKKGLKAESTRLLLKGTTNMTTHTSRFFKITHPFASDNQRIMTLAGHMDAAMDTFQQMNLVKIETALSFFREYGNPRVVIFNRKSDWRGKCYIHMPELAKIGQEMDPMEYLARWHKMLEIKFNMSQETIEDFTNEELGFTAYMWVYRMLYYPYFGNRLDWFAIASSIWLKEKYWGVAEYEPEKFLQKGLSPFIGMEKGLNSYEKTEKLNTIIGGQYNKQQAWHAISMVPLLKFLDGAYPEDKGLYFRIMTEILRSNSRIPTEGIINAITDPEYVWWPGFFKKFLTNQLYPIPITDFLETVEGPNHILFYNEIDTTVFNDGMYGDLSATLYRINFVFDEFNENAVLKIKLGPPSLNFEYVTAMAFGQKGGTFEYFDHAPDLDITDLATIKRNGYQAIIVAVINSGNEPPFDETREITLDTRLAIAPKDFNWLTFKVKARATYNYLDGSSSEGTYTYADAKLRTGEMVNYTFTSTWSEPYSDGTSSGTIEIVFDPERFPNYISSYNLTETQKLSNTRTYTITGENIELYGYKDYSGAYSFYHSGEGTKNYITSLDKTYSDGTGYGYATDGVPITNSSSYIEIRMGTE